VGPSTPGGPVEPLKPGGPADPFKPGGPAGPAGPAGPGGPFLFFVFAGVGVMERSQGWAGGDARAAALEKSRSLPVLTHARSPTPTAASLEKRTGRTTLARQEKRLVHARLGGCLAVGCCCLSLCFRVFSFKALWSAQASTTPRQGRQRRLTPKRGMVHAHVTSLVGAERCSCSVSTREAPGKKTCAPACGARARAADWKKATSRSSKKPAAHPHTKRTWPASSAAAHRATARPARWLSGMRTDREREWGTGAGRLTPLFSIRRAQTGVVCSCFFSSFHQCPHPHPPTQTPYHSPTPPPTPTHHPHHPSHPMHLPTAEEASPRAYGM
jgi:hypothetical protein